MHVAAWSRQRQIAGQQGGAGGQLLDVWAGRARPRSSRGQDRARGHLPGTAPRAAGRLRVIPRRRVRPPPGRSGTPPTCRPPPPNQAISQSPPPPVSACQAVSPVSGTEPPPRTRGGAGARDAHPERRPPKRRLRRGPALAGFSRASRHARSSFCTPPPTRNA